MTVEANNILQPREWVSRYADKFFAYARARVSDSVIAEDIVQETFLSALKSKHLFKGQASEQTWLYAILKRKIVDHYRKNAKSKEKAFSHQSPFTEDGFMSGQWIESRAPKDWRQKADSELMSDEFKSVLQACLSRLKSKQAAAFKLKTFEDYETEEVCKELDITPSNLWVLIHRARLQLRECLEKNWFV